MNMGYKARRRFALLILLIGLPIYIVISVSLMTYAQGYGWALQLFAYVLLGFAWIIPVRSIFLGVGRAELSGAQPKE